MQAQTLFFSSHRTSLQLSRTSLPAIVLDSIHLWSLHFFSFSFSFFPSLYLLSLSLSPSWQPFSLSHDISPSPSTTTNRTGVIFHWRSTTRSGVKLVAGEIHFPLSHTWLITDNQPPTSAPSLDGLQISLLNFYHPATWSVKREENMVVDRRSGAVVKLCGVEREKVLTEKEIGLRITKIFLLKNQLCPCILMEIPSLSLVSYLCWK